MATLLLCSTNSALADDVVVGAKLKLGVLPAICPGVQNGCKTIQQRIVELINSGLIATASAIDASEGQASYIIRSSVRKNSGDNGGSLRLRVESATTGLAYVTKDVAVPDVSNAVAALGIEVADQLIPSGTNPEKPLVVVVRGPHQVFEDTNTNANDLPELETAILANLTRSNVFPELSSNTLQRFNVATTNDPEQILRSVCMVAPTANFYTYGTDLERHTNPFVGMRSASATITGTLRTCTSAEPKVVPSISARRHYLGANGKIVQQVVNLANFALSVARKNPSYARALGNGLLTNSAVNAVVDPDDTSAIRNAKLSAARSVSCEVAKLVVSQSEAGECK